MSSNLSENILPMYSNITCRKLVKSDKFFVLSQSEADLSVNSSIELKHSVSHCNLSTNQFIRVSKKITKMFHTLSPNSSFF